MQKQEIATTAAPKAAGPYSQGISFGDLVFVAGQRPADPVTGAIPDGISAQTRQVLENVRAILEAGGSSTNAVLKVNVYLTDLGDFAAMNEVYREFFGEPHPVRTTVGVALRGILVEIDAIAYREKT